MRFSTRTKKLLGRTAAESGRAACGPGARRRGRARLLLARELFQMTAKVPAQWKLRAVAQQNDVVPVKRGLQLLDLVEVNDRRAIHARETVRAEARFESA